MKSNNTPFTILLAGNPNVGKSTIFNTFTRLHQHTGNWTGKTVEGATGYFNHKGKKIRIIDTPGCYSLSPFSPEEKVTLDAIAFTPKDRILIVCDASSPLRGIYFTLTVMELFPNVVLCFNLQDQGEKRGIIINTSALSQHLGIPVITTSSKDRKSLARLKDLICEPGISSKHSISYSSKIEEELLFLEEQIKKVNTSPISSRFLAIKILEQDLEFLQKTGNKYHFSFHSIDGKNALKRFSFNGYSPDEIEKLFTKEKQALALKIYNQTITNTKPIKTSKTDRFLTSKIGSFLLFSLLLFFVFFITIYAAQAPSRLLQQILFSLESPLTDFLTFCCLPSFLVNMLSKGMYRVVAFVISVMLPPMAIFFPLFTLLEDFGLLPRIAFNLDAKFARCNACGKQSLTMCMGLGCNATGVTGCRIIHSQRERNLAIVTNSLVPCNGRFPTLITLLTLLGSFFFTENSSPLLTTVALTIIILITVFITFFSTYILSITIFKGKASCYTLELPSFRKPKIGQVLVRSLFERTITVLWRSLLVAAPAGILLWCLTNCVVNGQTIATIITQLLNPLGILFGLDGCILLAFLLGLPANEIIFPILLMLYTKSGTLTQYESLFEMKAIFAAQNVTIETLLCLLTLMIFHSPCSTTLITVYKETKSRFITLLAFAIPTTIGLLGCFFIHCLFILF